MDKGTREFKKAIVKYFMDFLETDFHKRSAPKKKIVLTSGDNLTIGCNLRKFNKIGEKLSKLLNKDLSATLIINKGEYTNNLKEASLIKLLELFEKTCFDSVETVRELFGSIVLELFKNNKILESDVVINEVCNNKLIELLESNVISSFVDDNQDAFIKVGILEQDLGSIKESLSNSMLSFFKDNISEIIQKYREDSNIDVRNNIDFINVKNMESIIKDYFKTLAVSDLFVELSKMNLSKKVLDKQEFYLSIFDISFKGNKYPIFYIPFEVLENETSFHINFDAQVYINKKCVEYIVQELKDDMVLIGMIESIAERIIYLSECETPSLKLLQIINDILNYFSLRGSFSNDYSEIQSVKNEFITITNSIYFNIFDNADDALVNDYEELLQSLNLENSLIAKIFDEIINNFMTKEPLSFNEEVEDEWEHRKIEDKLVYPAPVPLNEEQIKILQALSKDDCNYIMVQGPPGTGKSHTITAIVFDMILKNKSVLVLSDKKEALDVVEDKITNTLNEVRVNDEFQNPILRLGKTGSTYSKILSKSSLDNIKSSYKVIKYKANEIDNQIDKYINIIKKDIKEETEIGEKINLQDVLELEMIENTIKDFVLKIDVEELYEIENFADDVFDLFSLVEKVEDSGNLFYLNEIFELYDIEDKDNFSIHNLEECYEKMEKYAKYIYYIEKTFPDIRDILQKYDCINEDDFKNIEDYCDDYFEIEGKIFKFLFRKKQLIELINNVKDCCSEFDETDYKLGFNELNKIIIVRNYLEEKGLDVEYAYNLLKKIIFNQENDKYLSFISEMIEKVKSISEIASLYPNNFGNMNYDDIFSMSSNLVVTRTDYEKFIRYLELKNKLVDDFSEIKLSRYLACKNELQSLITNKTTMIMDGRVISFYENNSNSAMLLKKIIQSKKKFPREEFNKLKNAFPCILAGIRDYAEYIPLEPEIFDLVIIDEASQVSIAQALPALIRAKKVLVLGDKKQFSNVKSNQARIEINNEYKNSISNAYKNSSYYNPAYVLKLNNFDIKSSILEFFESISNYQAMLYKYFRGYKEIIGYSNNYFYDNKLQVMKIRGKNIDDVIKFKKIDFDDKIELRPKTNMLEFEYIRDELLRLLAENYMGDVGIITPHTNQQRLISSELRKIPEFIDLERKFNLKVMTFDSCQGEERDIIYYSMVANPKKDSLWGVFPKDMKNVDLEEDGNLRAQRLNVGFSRAKECMHFVISKEISEFSGEIGNALRFYLNTIEMAKKEKSLDAVDKKSPMEPLVLQWFYQTKFWKENNEFIEFLPQFKLGKYLQQLDRGYNHPLYCVDFLLLYKKDNKNLKIIIEYDGFREHFEDLVNVCKDNFSEYYKESDVYRQKVLEGYGYKFLRINKFNIGDNPVDTLNNRIMEIVDKKNYINDTFSDNIYSDIIGIKNGDKKECYKCGRILDKKEFQDSSLVSGVGRICKSCKNKTNYSVKKYPNLNRNNFRLCPKCGSKLLIKSGPYGAFMGCSNYPSCRYTRRL